MDIIIIMVTTTILMVLIKKHSLFRSLLLLAFMIVEAIGGFLTNSLAFFPMLGIC